ncbi:hypothetical protein Bcav_0888 [Beutenbergia cavernae DSM 12333]|uniref:Polyketide cyclase/dehydrase n=1 Tax=Beutenbergia cavernae (strain ATCC BAA-8 / DSM 12333 / CCUG 43141 / JCM 11478 / NBRC 16432 / NCIMB 13614 / HKI 0122) TaxID=471853 RepID=C5BZH7_BEUC1|nr:SRPBCC family protein [Beutenbergia cavernae]ACQ79149.1 hypothetical protein Bcav_0888 [Beutenbergia cavernae DSM 12333]
MPAAVSRVLALPPADAFALVTDLPRHDRWIPFTRVQGPRRPHPGARYSALSLGVLRDRMELTVWREPDDDAVGVATYVKHGPVLLGTSTLTVRPHGTDAAPSSSLVTWSYDAWLAVLPPRATRRATSASGRAMAALALARMGRAVSSGRLPWRAAPQVCRRIRALTRPAA